MSISRRRFLACAALLGSSAALTGTLSGCSQKQESKIERAYVNGKVYTANADSAWTEAFAIADGKFAAVGTSDEINAMVDNSTEVIDLAGATVIPGLIEGHTHFGFMAAMHSLGYIEIPSGTTTLEDSLEQLRQFVADNPDYDQYVIGNFSQSLDLGAKSWMRSAPTSPLPALAWACTAYT